MERQNIELMALNKELESFSYSVSHDLRAPLRQIDGFSKIILVEAESLSPDLRECLQQVRMGTKHMGQLVDDLLNFLAIGTAGVDPARGESQSLDGIYYFRERNIAEYRHV